MAARQSTPSSDNAHSDSGVRKRVCKACDRCRLKKSKCDGAKPCGRCRADNTLCVFGERKKAHDKVYPKGYVEMLEQQQTWLVNGLQVLYQRLVRNEGWQGEPLICEPNGQPLTHDLLTQLGALDASKHERFEEHADAMQQELWKQNAGHMQRQDSSDTSSESVPSPVMPAHFSDHFASHTATATTTTTTTLPQTPSNLRIDIPQSAVKSEPQLTPSNPHYMHNNMPLPPGIVNPSELQSAHLQQGTQWSSPGFADYEDIELMSAGAGAQYNMPYEDVSSPLFTQPSRLSMGCIIGGPGPYMDNKNDFDDLSQFLNVNSQGQVA